MFHTSNMLFYHPSTCFQTYQNNLNLDLWCCHITWRGMMFDDVIPLVDMSTISELESLLMWRIFQKWPYNQDSLSIVTKLVGGSIHSVITINYFHTCFKVFTNFFVPFFSLLAFINLNHKIKKFDHCSTTLILGFSLLR